MSDAARDVAVSEVQSSALPPGAQLARHAAAGAYTDCYVVSVPGRVTLAQLIGAFYTTAVFKLERWILARFAGLPSTDEDALSLARGDAVRFAAWQLEAREPDQALLAAGRTRSWLMVAPAPEGAPRTTLYFGSAVLPRAHGDLGWPFRALLGFHRVYSRILLAAAARRLAGGAS